MTQPVINYAPEICALCAGRGTDIFGNLCKACGGAGSLLVAQPAKKCALCKGKGIDIFGNLCKVCGGTGWAHVLRETHSS